ncbi:unnamed protein product [Didymodactylos carnosus]|uniref:NAD(P)(+)--arginine ADP-ribosyltransferase n=2 Tax=Didymodactylos carnosus TaxID=1234261 RepID=A0A8S2DZH3_9BILA|nr:unnamed protein product [Didymodactylos carnosus]CAF3856724.1 unnamed protein product [Didymodactylos carnosus]
MGSSPSVSDRIIAPYSSHAYHQPHLSKQVQGGQVNPRLFMSPGDNGDNRNSQQMYKSISGYKEMRLLTLEQACQGLSIQNLAYYVKKAKNYSKYPKQRLTQDEQAAINLYTQHTTIYQLLNDALRQTDGRALSPWYGYLKLFLTALHKLPPYRGTVWRGVPHDLSTKYCKNGEQIWWAFSSCTSSLDILRSPNFLGDTGVRTLFNIEVFNGRLISEFSEYSAKDEILLLPGTYVRVVSEMRQSDGLHIIHLKQIEPPYFLLEPPGQVGLTPKPASQYNKQQNKIVNDEISSEENRSDEDNSEFQNTSTVESLSTFNTQIQLAKSISSDSEKAQVLKHILANKNLSDEMIAGVAECVGTIYSAKEKGDVVQLIAKRSGLSEKQFRVSVKAINGISADNQKAISLKAFLLHEQFTGQHLDVVLSAVGTIYSSADKQNVFTDLIRNRYLKAQHFPSILNEIREMSNDSHKSDVLCKLAPRLPKNDANVRQAYLMAADSIYSSKEKAAATMAFVSEPASKGSKKQKKFADDASGKEYGSDDDYSKMQSKHL